VWCKFCQRLCASEGQLQHQISTKNHKRKLKDLGIEEPLSLVNTMSFIESQLHPAMFMNDSEDGRVITALKKKEINIPFNVKRVLQVKKQKGRKDVQDLTYSVVIMENEDIVAVLDYDFYKAKAEESNFLLPRNFVNLNRDGGVVKRKKGGGEMKMFGCKSFMHMWGTYKQSINGNDPEEREYKRMKKKLGEKLSSEQLDVVAGELTHSLCVELEKKMASWMVTLRKLIPRLYGNLWGRLDMSPFTTMGLTKNYWMPKQIDKKRCWSKFHNLV
jgi:hypothetical protein